MTIAAVATCPLQVTFTDPVPLPVLPPIVQDQDAEPSLPVVLDPSPAAALGLPAGVV